MLTTILEQYGAEVTAAGSSIAALFARERIKPDVLVIGMRKKMTMRLFANLPKPIHSPNWQGGS